MSIHPAAIPLHADLNGRAVPLRHPWRACVGSCHAPTALRADWQAQLRQARTELGFDYVRFHGLLGDDMGTLICQSEQLVYSFFNIDQIFDFLLSIGVRPIVELSFMPSTLSSGGNTVFHYRANVTPPRDYAQWGELMRRLAAHWVDRYGIEEVAQWYFEVWNEPNLEAFWTGGQAGYFALYDSTVTAIKGVDARLRVGGPATAQNAWVSEFLAFCGERALPVDFISTHYYPTDAFGEIGADTITQLEHAPLDVMRARAIDARAQAAGRPLLYTEWNVTSNPRDALHDTSFAAALALRIAMSVDDVVDAYSYWSFTDIFEENYFPSVPFHGGFGLFNLHGIKKPIYSAFAMLGALGERHYPLLQDHPTVQLWIGDSAGDATVAHVLCINQAMPRHPIGAEDIALRLNARPGQRARAVTLACIDDAHANPAQAWRAMGQPEYLSPAQVAALKAAALPLPVALAFCQDGAELALDFALAAQSVTLLRIDWEPH
ncbi:MAG: glycosyl hydrolase [Pseudomonadota bacterium]|nr:glycosyl hydrolase [Pseudomonadota bacterium]